jgi:uncharacterized protein involved in outer membrane biogenesis
LGHEKFGEKEGSMRWKWIVLTSMVIIVGLIATVCVILLTYNYDRLKPEIAQAFKKATGRELTLNGNIKLKISYAPTLVVENVSLQNASWASQPEMASIKRFEVQVALLPLIFGRVDVERLILIDPDILIETSRSGQSNLDFLKKTASAKTKKEAPAKGGVELTVNELRMDKGRITYRNGRSGKSYLVTVDSLAASATSAENPVRLKLKGSYNGEPFEIAGTSVPLGSLTRSGRPWPLNLTLSVTGATLTLDGTIKDVPDLQGIDIKFTAKSEDLDKLSWLAGKSLPRKVRLDISGQITDPGPMIYEISDFKVALNDSDLAGSIRLNFSSNRPILTSSLLSKRLDLRPLFQKGTQKEKARTAASERERIFPSEPLPLDTLQQADATVNLRAAKVLLPEIALQDLTVRMTLKDGGLSAKPLTSVVGGGTLDGHFDLRPLGNGSEMEMVMRIDHLNVAAMLKEVNIVNVLEGHIDANINVRARGSSIAGLMAGLNGKAFLIMGNGQINNEYIGLLGSDLSSSIFRLVNPFHKEAPYTKVSCIVCGFNIRNGLAETTALVVNTSYMSMIGNGKVNLKTERLDLKLRPIPKEGIGTSVTGKLSLSLGELARPFKLAGTLTHPSLAIDLTQTGITIGKAVGGFLLFGPIGIVGALTGASSGEKNLCPLAVKAAEEGVKLSVVERHEKRKGVVGEAKQGVEKGIGEAGKELKKLFGK